MKTTNNKQLTNIIFVLEYDRDNDRQTPNKIERTKELLRTKADYAFCSVSFSCGINTQKDTIAEYNTYIDVNSTDVNELIKAVGAIWGGFVYLQDTKLKHYSKDSTGVSHILTSPTWQSE
jgi:hypothetical protein